MAFTTLEQRFSQVSNQIYSRYAPSPEQLNVVAPGTPSNIQNDSRSLPIVSTARDVSRLTKFARSSEGLLFIGKQTLLQTGNTFAETRLYNPLNILLTAVPFIGTGITRHVGKPIGVKSLKTPTRNLRGALQQETLDKFYTNTQGGLAGLSAQLRNAVVSPFAAYNYEPKLTKYFGDPTKEYYLRPEDGFYTVPMELVSNIINGRLVISTLGTAGVAQYRVQSLAERGDKKPNILGRGIVNTFSDGYVSFATSKIIPIADEKRSFKQLENTLQTNGYFAGRAIEILNITPDTDNGAAVKAKLLPNADVAYPTIADPYNNLNVGVGGNIIGTGSVDRNVQAERPPIPTIYTGITGDPRERNPLYEADGIKSDIIKFIFRTNEFNANPVHFRAFISSLKENVKPEFSEQRYIGRTERFVTYSGAKRTANMEFNIVAFGRSEINPVWKRINYLTGLAFPKGYTDSGFMIPPLFKITIGGIYEDQPCYIDTLDYDFIDENITFDIDEEVPQVVNVKMNIILLEKTSKYFDSPFYKITETA